MGLTVGTIALIAAGTAAAGSAATSYLAAEEQQDVADRQNAENRQRRIESRRAEFRRRRIATAKVKQGAESAGTSGSSGEAGTLGSLATQGAQFAAGDRLREQVSTANASSSRQINKLNQAGSIFDAAQQIAGSVALASGPTAPPTETDVLGGVEVTAQQKPISFFSS